MALMDAYADATAYRDRVKDRETGSNTVLNAQLLSASRLAERSLRVAPGAFNSATGTRVFDGTGTNTLYLRDTSGLASFLQSIDADGLKIDEEMNGLYDDYLWDLSDAWLRGLPENAAASSEPFTALQIRNITTAPRTTFPAFEGCVQITGTWGWAAVPNEITEFVVHLVHEVRQGHMAGPTLELPTIDGAQALGSGDLWRRWAEIKRQYGRKIPVLA